MAFVAIQRPNFVNLSSHGISCSSNKTTFAPCRLAMKTKSLLQTPEQIKPILKEPLKFTISPSETASSGVLRFDRLQTPNEELVQKSGYDFGRFVTREAIVDEEYWTAAWLRAETHWEDKTNGRYVNSCKKKFAEQEFNALKRRQKGSKSSCIVAVKKSEGNVKQSVLKSVVGTLDLNIRSLLPGETFPGEREASVFCNMNNGIQYGYIANVCVAKSARRQGIASNMVPFAVQLARENGTIQQVYMHVHRKNQPARDLYEKMGFKVVEMATSQLEKEQTYLLCLQL
ncbi:uncharacterized protein LOC124926596 [Impatiens glandulifera]|uniref:uncharacterized protein LOC124926596 n=1 Tax=Impatiens glandulifera TaxID=253017 RepID=UPI001FB186BC|nr:uncharacterized protein LOC124926596 [Impatiens glandulifera]